MLYYYYYGFIMIYYFQFFQKGKVWLFRVPTRDLPRGGVIDVRYELRVPTHEELKLWGVRSLNTPGSTFGALGGDGAQRKALLKKHQKYPKVVFFVKLGCFKDDFSRISEYPGFWPTASFKFHQRVFHW